MKVMKWGLLALVLLMTTSFVAAQPVIPPVTNIVLSADPTVIQKNGVSTLTAQIESDYLDDRSIKFEIVNGSDLADLAMFPPPAVTEGDELTVSTNESGVAQAYLVAGSEAGTVKIRACWYGSQTVCSNTVTVYITETTPIKPDLIVEDISVTPESGVPETCDVGPAVGENVTLAVTIKNIGTSDAGSFDVALNIDGESMVKTISGLSVNESMEVQFTWTPESAGNYTVTVEVDVNNTVSELNEENNELTKQVMVLDDHVPDNLEQILGKYIDFDWRTQTPTKEDIVDAVTNAVYEYFNTDDPELKQEIVDDVSWMVYLYFSPCI